MMHWTLRDMRRSMASALAGAGFSEGVVDRIQSHVAAGSRPSQVSAVDQLNEMLDERARALDHWAAIVMVRGQSATNVVNLPSIRASRQA